MSKRKRRDHVQLDFYNQRLRHLQSNNSSQNEEALLRFMYERILSELAMNRFEWVNMIDTIPQRFLETELHTKGLVIVFRDTVSTAKRIGTDKVFAATATPSATVNMYGDPTAFTLTGRGLPAHFHARVIPASKCVPIYPNYLRQTDWDIIESYARRLASIDRTIEINLNSARRTKVLAYDENTRLSAENLNRQIDQGDPTVRIKMDSMILPVALDMGIEPKTIETLSVIRGRLWSEAMGLLGIDNANQDKKERLVESEVNANEDQVDNMRFVNLNSRQDACRKMRKMFPEELGQVAVNYRSTLEARREQIEAALGMGEVNA